MSASGDSKRKDKSSPMAAAASSNPPATENAESAVASKPSKSQLKRQRRWEKAMEKKKRRKQQEKEAKVAKALAEGRDLEEERRLLEERTKSGVGHERREAKWLQRMKSADTSFRVCLDCAFSDQMTYKELGSLAMQIRYCYSVNRKADHPVYFSVSSLAEGTTLGLLKKVEGFPDSWLKRAFSYSDKPLHEMHPDTSKLVYLTSDSENTLQHLEDDKIYVIGGIVDRNRLKRAAINRAESLGIATAKLPIDAYLQFCATKVLTCNHVFEILSKYRANGNDWKKAMLDVLPHRKDVQVKDEKEHVESTKDHEGKNESDNLENPPVAASVNNAVNEEKDND